MVKNEAFELESLPNEILIVLFEYFDARDLFRAFFNLNTRFNDLLRSLNHLSLAISAFNRAENENDKTFLPYIHHLIVDDPINIDFARFTQIHCLVLMHATYEQIQQLKKDILPDLKHLSIRHLHGPAVTHVSDLCEKIFSNEFPRLQSCSFSNRSPIRSAEQWLQLPSLRILEVGLVDFFVYQTILSLCPNLYSLKLTTFVETKIPSEIKSHVKIKQLTLKNDYFFQSWNTRAIEAYLSCVPNLEELCLYRHIFSSNLKNCRMNYDWCGSRLPLLRRFQFYLHVIESAPINLDHILRQLLDNFQSTSNARYQSCFVVQRSQMPNLF